MKLSRSSFYHKPKNKSRGEMQKKVDLRGKIEATCLEYPVMAISGLLNN